MQDQRSPDRDSTVRFSEEHLDCEVLHFMLLGDQGWPWSVDEIAREMGDEINAIDAVRRLIATGLLHRLGDFVFPTRTARRARELQIGTL